MLSQVKRARGHLAAVRARVLSASPEEVHQCIPTLEDAAVCLRELVTGRRQLKADLYQELVALRFELGVLSRLVQRGTEFYQGWAKVLAADAGYTATGEPAPVPAAGVLSVKG